MGRGRSTRGFSCPWRSCHWSAPATADPMALLAAIAIIAGASIAYEILLTRLFSILLWHHFAYMIISVALLGIGASGTFLAFAREILAPRFTEAFAWCAMLFAVFAMGGFALAQRVPFNPLESSGIPVSSSISRRFMGSWRCHSSRLGQQSDWPSLSMRTGSPRSTAPT